MVRPRHVECWLVIVDNLQDSLGWRYKTELSWGRLTITSELCVFHHVASESVHNPAIKRQHEGSEVEQRVTLKWTRPRDFNFKTLKILFEDTLVAVCSSSSWCEDNAACVEHLLVCPSGKFDAEKNKSLLCYRCSAGPVNHTHLVRIIIFIEEWIGATWIRRIIQPGRVFGHIDPSSL